MKVREWLPKLSTMRRWTQRQPGAKVTRLTTAPVTIARLLLISLGMDSFPPTPFQPQGRMRQRELGLDEHALAAALTRISAEGVRHGELTIREQAAQIVLLGEMPFGCTPEYGCGCKETTEDNAKPIRAIPLAVASARPTAAANDNDQKTSTAA